MLAITILQFLGLTALGLLLGIVVTPLILCLGRTIASVLALTVVLLRATLTFKLSPKQVLKVFPKLLKDLPKYMNKPIHESQGAKDNICFPKPVHNTYQSRDAVIVAVSQTETPKKSTNGSSYTDNQNRHHMVKQPTIKKASDTTPDIFHRVILFYKSYYGHSTKVEKNHGCIVEVVERKLRW